MTPTLDYVEESRLGGRRRAARERHTGPGEGDGPTTVPHPIRHSRRGVAHLDSQPAHVGEHVRRIGGITRGRAQIHGLDPVPLRQRVAAEVPGHRAREPGRSGDRAEQRGPGAGAVATVQDGVARAVHELHHLLTNPPGTVPMVQPAKVVQVVGEDLDVRHPEATPSGPGPGVRGGRGDSEQCRLTEGRRAERGAHQERAALHVPSRQLDDGAERAVQRTGAAQAIVPVLRRRCAVGETALGDHDLTPQPSGQDRRYQSGHRPPRLGPVQHPRHGGGARPEVHTFPGAGGDDGSGKSRVANFRLVHECALRKVAATCTHGLRASSATPLGQHILTGQRPSGQEPDRSATPVRPPVHFRGETQAAGSTGASDSAVYSCPRGRRATGDR